MMSGSHDEKANDVGEWMRHARRGHLEGAWRVSDRLRDRSAGPRDWTVARHLQQVWDGTPLDDQRVLIRCYHGLGDTIQFVRYAEVLHRIAREVMVWAQPELLPVLQSADGIDRLLPLHDGVPDAAYDVDIEIMELPYAFRTTVATIPSRVPYLTSQPMKLLGPGPRVGVVWRAGEWDSHRSIDFRELEPLFTHAHVSWYALQLDRRPSEHHRRLHLLDTCAIASLASAIAALDLVISVDSMPAHLAGALGVPVWTLLPRNADWRWMDDGDGSPWYPTMRLFRQADEGWGPVISSIGHALQTLPHHRA